MLSLSDAELKERLSELMRGESVDALVFTNHDNVVWVSDYEPIIESGPSPFNLIPPTAIVTRDGEDILIISNHEVPRAARESGFRLCTYPGYTVHEQDNPSTQDVLRLLSHCLLPVAGSHGHVAVDSILAQALIQSAPGLQNLHILDLRHRMIQERMIKTVRQLERIRTSVRLTDIAHQSLRDHLVPGMTELELFHAVRSSIESEAGCRVPVTGDLISGNRTSQGVGWPTNRVISSGDLVIADIAPCFGGYWADSCNTLCCGDIHTAFERMFRAVHETLQELIGMIRPGIPASTVDAFGRRQLESRGYTYFHHTGHGIGTSVHESPRLVPHDDTVLRANMVLAVEPGAYVEGLGGIRNEYVIAVTCDGCEVLSGFAHGLR